MGKLTIGQAAQALGITKQAIHNRIRRNAIKAEKIEKMWYIPQGEIDYLRMSQPEPEIEEEYVCNNCEKLQTRLDSSERMVEMLLRRVEWLEEQTERTTILLAAEQQERRKVLPSPMIWLKRLFYTKGKEGNT